MLALFLDDTLSPSFAQLHRWPPLQNCSSPPSENFLSATLPLFTVESKTCRHGKNSFASVFCLVVQNLKGTLACPVRCTLLFDPLILEHGAEIQDSAAPENQSLAAGTLFRLAWEMKKKATMLVGSQF